MTVASAVGVEEEEEAILIVDLCQRQPTNEVENCCNIALVYYVGWLVRWRWLCVAPAIISAIVVISQKRILMRFAW